MKQVLIVRHGNTFRPDEPPRRVGGATDLPLVESERASRIGVYLAAAFRPDAVYSSPLLRTRQTAEIALQTAKLESTNIIFDDRFIEIDYGPDENKEEAQVIARIGQQSMDLWNEKAIVPDGWVLNIEALKQSWINFFNAIEQDDSVEKVLVVTSNGIARFAPAILGNSESPIQSLKIKTGNMSLFELKDRWSCTFWDEKPLDQLSH